LWDYTKASGPKALTSIYKHFKTNDIKLVGAVKFGIQETTRLSKHKVFWYSGEKKELDEPIKMYVLPENQKNDAKKYFTKNKIKQIGGFENIFGKKEEDIVPSIVFNSCNTVKKISQLECEHLLNYQNNNNET
jgi:hypothetical protein